MQEKIYNDLNSELILDVIDEQIGLKGFLVLDTTIGGLSCGGLRIKPDVTKFELQNLARTMSLKQAFVGLPRGGGRAGIIADYGLPDNEKQVLLNRFGEIVHEYLKNKKHLLAPDVGSDSQLIRNLYQHLGESVIQKSKLSVNSGFFTSVSVYHCTKFCAELAGIDIANSNIAIEGFGRVGLPLAQQLHKLGCKIVAVSNLLGGVYNENGLDIADIIYQSRKVPGDEWILNYENTTKLNKEELVGLPLDIFCPCATDSTLHSKNMHLLEAKVVCAGANDPVSLAANDFLHDRGILYFPDFITNCGGVLGNSVQYFGLGTNFLRQLIQTEVFVKLQIIYDISTKTNRSLREVAIDITEHKLGKLKKRKEQKEAKNIFLDWGLQFHRKGLVPKFITKRYGKNALRKMIRSQ